MNISSAVITCSDTASADPAADRSGPLAAQLLAQRGLTVAPVVVVPDEIALIQQAVRSAVAAGHRVVVCTGGTGLGPRDVTPEALTALGARPLPGIGEAIRAASRERVPVADLSRGGAYVLDSAVVLALPGSPGGVRDGLAVAGPLLAHAVAMLAGAGHPTGPAPNAHTLVGPAPIDPTATSTAGHPTGVGPPAPSLVGPAPIDPAELASAVSRDDAGAVVVFDGRVRDHDHGRSVTALTYEAHPSAREILATVVAEASDRPGVLAAAARHRTGSLRIGDAAFVVAVAAAHRREAFAACAWLVDEAKDRLPIWKNQVFDDGTSEWVNCP